MAKKPVKIGGPIAFEKNEGLAPGVQTLVSNSAIRHLKALITAVKSHDAHAAECIADEAQAFINKLG